MKLIVLTTQTMHHAYFVRELQRVHKDIHVMIETKSIEPPFTAAHPFEVEREEYERNALFCGEDAKLAHLADCSEYENINEEAAKVQIASFSPEAVIVFGTGIIRPPLIEIVKGRIINLHGGDPEYYRGLDSHLWTIYHKDFDRLVTTIHHVNQNLDDGGIIMKWNVPIYQNMELYQLRKNNTDVCIKLALNALSIFLEDGSFPAVKQRTTGRYYSFMPDVIKQICVKNFESYTSALRR